MLFARIGNEEDATIDEAAVIAEPITPEEVVEEQAEAEEVAAIVEETTGDVEAMAQAEEAEGDIEEQVAADETKLETPETVTAADALVSQEHLHMAAKMLGADQQVVFGARISHESAESNPATALQLSVEGAKEFLLKIAEQVKAIFQRIVMNIKKLYVKAVVMISRTEKTAIKMKDSISKRGEAAAEADFEVGDVSGIASRLGAVIIGSGHTELGADPMKVFAGYIDSLKTPTAVKNTIAAIKSTSAIAIGAISGDAAKGSASLEKLVDSLKEIDPSGNTGFLNDVEGNLGNGKFSKSTLGNAHVVAVIGTRVQCVGVIDSADKKIENSKFAAGVVTVTPDALKSIKVAVPSKAEVLKVLDGVIAISKATKAFSDAALAEVDAADKLIASVTAEVKKAKEVTPVASLAVTKFINAARVSTASVTLNAILAQVNGAKALLAYCSISSKHFPAAGKSE